MTSDDYVMMANKVRSMRTDLKRRKEKLNYLESWAESVYINGRIMGLTDVLLLLSPDPLADN